jgi:hypothetical protein
LEKKKGVVMTTFDWQSFFDRYGIEYTDRGPSTAKDNLYVHCPMCGDADQGKHMGVSLKNRGWGCWRRSDHRGKAPARLIQALLGVSYAEAQEIAGASKRAFGNGLGGLVGAVSRALGQDSGVEPPARLLSLPASFKPLKKGGPHWDYMHGPDRGYVNWEIKELVSRFDLREAWRDRDWAWRVIIPIYDEHGKVITWTGRAIAKSRLRYKTLSPDPEKESNPAKAPITDHLFDMKNLMKGGKFLAITEGPFDVMSLWLETHIIRQAQVTCLFGKAISPPQIDDIVKLRNLYEAIFLLLDPDASLDMMRMTSHLTALGVKLVVQKTGKDPGEMSHGERLALLKDLSHRVSHNDN